MRVRSLVIAFAVALSACVLYGSSDDEVADDDDVISQCDALDAQQCRTTAGCELDICYACSCAASYTGCRRASDTPHECPALGCPMPLCCSDQADCGSGGLACAGPEDPPGCGACNNDPGNCTTDAQCAPGSGMICEPVRCSCADARSCVPGCTADSECAAGESCDLVAHRCGPRACGNTILCPPDFDCAAPGQCVRRACQDDTACDGFCVNGRCESERGVCTPPVP